MSTPAHGPIVQNAFIVADIDAGIEHWVRVMEVGPFFKFPPIVFSEADYRGRAEAPQFEAAIAYSGDLMIELIKPNGPSIFQEFLDEGRTGVHHLAVLTDDMKLAQASVEKRGGRRVQGGRLVDGSSVAYYEMPDTDPSILEIAFLMPQARGLFAAIKAAGAAWNGRARTVNF